MKAAEIIAAVVALLGVAAFTEWRINAYAEDVKEAMAAAEKVKTEVKEIVDDEIDELEDKIDTNDAQARERGEFFKREHAQKSVQMDRVEGKLDSLIFHLATGGAAAPAQE